MHAQHCVVRLDHCSCNLKAARNRETDLSLLAVINRHTIKQQACQNRVSATSTSIVYDETMQTNVIVDQFTEAVKYQVNNFFTKGAQDQLFWGGTADGKCQFALRQQLLASHPHTSNKEDVCLYQFRRSMC